MGMVDMAVEGNNDYSMPSDNPYGYGLCISLTEEQVEALGLDVNPPAVGSQVGICAIAKVVQVTSETEVDGDDDVDVRIQLQITSMEVTQDGISSTNAATVLYGM